MKGQAEALRLRPSSFWRVLQQSYDVADLASDPRREDRELLLQRHRLERQLPLEPSKFRLTFTERLTHPRRRAFVFVRCHMVLEPALRSSSVPTPVAAVAAAWRPGSRPPLR